MKEKGKYKDSITNIKKQNIIQQLRMKNYRITNQRLMLLDVILDGNCTCSKEIYYKAAKLNPGIGAATVYRTINALEDIGVINRKNLYQIECYYCADSEAVYKITLDDHSEIELSGRVWKRVVESGLKCCGIVDGQNLESIELIESNV